MVVYEYVDIPIESDDIQLGIYVIRSHA